MGEMIKKVMSTAKLWINYVKCKLILKSMVSTIIFLSLVINKNRLQLWSIYWLSNLVNYFFEG